MNTCEGRLEEWYTLLPKKLLTLRPILMVVAAASSSLAGAATLPSLMASYSHGNGSFLLTANPSSLTLSQGTSGLSTITLVSMNRFSGTVVLSVTFTNTSLPVSLSNNTVNVPVNGMATSILTITIPTTAAMGGYNVIVTGTGTGSRKSLSSSTLVSVLVTSMADFSISASPTTITNVAGLTNSTNIILTSLNGFSGTITLTATTPFGFISVMGGQNPVSLSAGGAASSTLQIATTTNTLPGTYDITTTGTSGQRSHSFMITVTVQQADPEALVLVGYRFNSATNLTIYIQNNGNTIVSLEQYKVEDSLGDAWTLTNWSGPAIGPNSMVATNILISTSCSACTYTGIFGLFSEFVIGQTYTITATTAMSNQFHYSIIR